MIQLLGSAFDMTPGPCLCAVPGPCLCASSPCLWCWRGSAGLKHPPGWGKGRAVCKDG